MSTSKISKEDFRIAASYSIAADAAMKRIDEAVAAEMVADPKASYVACYNRVKDQAFDTPVEDTPAVTEKPEPFTQALCFRSNGLSATNVTYVEGDLELSEDECMARINALLPRGAKQLTRADVYIHQMEAVNTRFLPDRYGFFDKASVRNTAKAAREGAIALMNAHRTGGFLKPSELPLGRSFAGRTEAVDDITGARRTRAVVYVYLLAGQFPNGAGGLGTDALHNAISGGTVFDVSVGVPAGSGRIVCDVCTREKSKCQHIAGETSAMTAEESRRQIERGVPGGRASMTFAGVTPNEVSVVHAGAVPGAGFGVVRSSTEAA